MNSLQELWNVYDYVRDPISSIAKTATRRIVGPIVEPLLRRSPAQRPSDSDNEPLVKRRDSDDEPLVKKQATRKKKPVPPSSDSDNKPLARTNPKRNPADIHAK